MAVFEKRKDGVGFQVLLTPRSARDQLAGRMGDAVKIKIKAPPVDGRANEALVKFLAKTLGVPAGRVRILSGLTSRSKTVAVEGLTPEQAGRALGVEV
jgi:hypothetical protein